MNCCKSSLNIRTILLLITTLTVSNPSLATWSIIAVDREKGEIGIAGASCTFDVTGIASIEPGKGAIVVQAASNYFARMQGVKVMEEHGSAEAILNSMKQEKFKPSRQQYGVVLLNNDTMPIVDTGSDVKGVKGSKINDSVAVMGNILTDQNVLDDAFNTFNKEHKQALSSRLMAALKAGADAGGDSRCAEQKARSAFVWIYSPETDSITRLSVIGLKLRGKPAVDLLEIQFNNLYRD